MDNLALDYSNFVPRLLIEVPEFEAMYREHMRDNHDELLPHMLMADFSRFLREAGEYMLSDPNSERWRQVIERSADLLDRAMDSSDERLRDLVYSFLENFNFSRKSDQVLNPFWGPHLQKALDLYYAYWRE